VAELDKKKIMNDEKGMILHGGTKEKKASDLEARLIDFAVRIMHFVNRY
jgi:hypothetical protein